MKKILLFIAGLMLAMSASAAVIVAGNGDEAKPEWVNGFFWSDSAEANTLVDGTITFKNVPAGVYQFKLVIDGNWTYPTISSASSKNVGEEGGNVQFITSMTSDITISYDGNECTIISSAGDFATEVITNVWTLVGEAGFTTIGWTPTNTAGDMEQISSGVFVFTAENISLVEGTTYTYKAVADHSWTTSIPSGSANAEYVAEETGLFDITFTLYVADKHIEVKTAPAASTAIDEADAEDAVVAAFDLLGRPVAADAAGYVILQYASGKSAKVFNY
jgi:hypothetical protein